MAKWLDSLATWRTRLSGLPRTDSVAKALAELGLLHVVIIHDRRRSLMRAPARKIRSPKDVAELLKVVYLRLPGIR